METMQALLSRQSVRAYQSKQLTDEQVKTLLQAAMAAPTAMGRFNEMHLTVIQNQELLKQITLQARKVSGKVDANPLYGAPTIIMVSCMTGRSTMAANAACMVENMSLAAADMGLGSVYLWGFIEGMLTNQGLVNALQLPDGFIPVSAIAVGYPEEELKTRDVPVNKVGVNYIL